MTDLSVSEAPVQVAAALDSNPPLVPYTPPASRVKAAREAVLRLVRSMTDALVLDEHGTYPGAS